MAEVRLKIIKNGSKQLTKLESQISAHSSPWARESSLQLFFRVKIFILKFMPKFRYLEKISICFFFDQNLDSLPKFIFRFLGKISIFKFS